MFSLSSASRPAIAIGALLLCAATPSYAIDQFSLNFEKIRFDYQPSSDDSPIPFAIELTINADGSVNAVLPGMHRHSNVTLKRGVINSAAPLAGALLQMRYGQDGPRPSELGMLSLEAIDAGNLGFEILDASPLSYATDADALSFSMDRASFGAGIELVFEAAPGRTLTGRPAHLFGPSGTGKTLTATLLGTAPGTVVELTIEVVDDRGTSIQVPITIKHNV